MAIAVGRSPITGGTAVCIIVWTVTAAVAPLASGNTGFWAKAHEIVAVTGVVEQDSWTSVEVLPAGVSGME